AFALDQASLRSSQEKRICAIVTSRYCDISTAARKFCLQRELPVLIRNSRSPHELLRSDQPASRLADGRLDHWNDLGQLVCLGGVVRLRGILHQFWPAE